MLLWWQIQSLLGGYSRLFSLSTVLFVHITAEIQPLGSETDVSAHCISVQH